MKEKMSTDIEKVNPQSPQHCIKVPKEIILETSLPEHRISTLLYLNYNQTWDETVNYSPVYMIQWSGYKPNWRAGKRENIYNKFSKCMQWYFEHEYILDFNANRYVQNTFQSSLLNKEKLMPSCNFGIIYDFEIEAIMKYQSWYKPLNKSSLLLLLSYIRAFTWNRKANLSSQLAIPEKIRPEIFHSQFEAMENCIGIKAKMISRATGILENLGIVKTYRMPSYKDANGQWHTDDIIYIFPYKLIVDKKLKGIRLCEKNEYDWHKELEHGINYLRERKFN